MLELQEWLSFSPNNIFEISLLERLFIWINTSLFKLKDFPWASLVTQMVKNVMRETWVQSLGWEDPVEKGMATYSSILAWKIPWIV